MDSIQLQELLRGRIQSSLKGADEFVRERRKANTALLVTGLVSSAGATLIAGITAAQGPIIGSGIEGWRLACIAAAIFAFAGTVSNGLSQQLKISEKLVEGAHCVNKLKSLELGMSTGTKTVEDVSREYEEIATSYPELIS